MKVLLVEDQPEVARALSRQLIRRGHEVRWAEDYASAIDALGTHTFDVVVLDREVGQYDGWSLAKTVEILTPKPRVVLMTGNPPPNAPEHFWKGGDSTARFVSLVEGDSKITRS